MLDQVPVQNDGTGHDVKAEDIREWLMFGIQEEDPDVLAAVGKVEVVQAEIEDVKRAMADVPFEVLFDAGGSELDGDAADAERQMKRRAARIAFLEGRLRRARRRGTRPLQVRRVPAHQGKP